MIHLRRRRGWEIAESLATPEASFLGRRRFLKTLGIAGAGWAAGSTLLGVSEVLAKVAAESPQALIGDAPRNPDFTLDRPLTDEEVAASYNNFYEFSEQKEAVKDLVGKFEPRPWRIEIAGMVEKPREIEVDDLIRRLPVEQRLYRFRCVEAWAMAVPWTGIPMREFVKWANPLSSARYVRTISFLRPKQAPNQAKAVWYHWPYYEALRLDEATNELALLAVGIYGHELPKQHGAPIRMVVPWKYGYKGAKSIVRFEFTDKQPATFWNDVAPKEYSFLSNVNPAVPHPRWSQATERMIGTGEKRPTQIYNGYGEWVAGLYKKS